MTFAVLPHPDETESAVVFRTGCEGNDEPSQHGPLIYFNCEGRLDEAVAAVEPNDGKVLQASIRLALWLPRRRARQRGQPHRPALDVAKRDI